MHEPLEKQKAALAEQQARDLAELQSLDARLREAVADVKRMDDRLSKATQPVQVRRAGARSPSQLSGLGRRGSVPG